MANTTTPVTSEDLLARVDEAWRPFREAIRGVGRARMDEPTGSGWTYRDLLAHVAAWHDLTTRRLRKLRETGTFPGPGDEVSFGADALLDELDAAFRSLRSELATLSDDQIHANDDWAIAIVTGNTFGHYQEHAKEVGLE